MQQQILALLNLLETFQTLFLVDILYQEVNMQPSFVLMEVNVRL